MTEPSRTSESPSTPNAVDRRLRRRYAAERRFRLYGFAAIAVALAFLALLLSSIAATGLGAFFQHQVRLEVDFDDELLGLSGDRDVDSLSRADYSALLRKSLRDLFPDVRGRSERRALSKLMSTGAGFQLRAMVLENPRLIGTRHELELPVSDDADLYFKGRISRDSAEGDRRLSDAQLEWLAELERRGRIERVFNARFFQAGDSREPELAGIRGALVGSLLTLLATLLLSFPVGVAAAIYLEEFAPKRRWVDWVEVNINNLAAVPSIVFGLLGLAVFLNFLGFPRSAPLVGGAVLALMTLPTIIIAARSALMAVPPSIREAALGVGASPLQVVTHHVLPLAMPGILTGTILGMARALGETAPLLMIGMVAFIVDVPDSMTAPSTVLPVQIYLWADSPERAFVEKTSAAILVLLALLIAMNLIAVLLRNRFERRW
jgi:phosphate transport system permease protein